MHVELGTGGLIAVALIMILAGAVGYWLAKRRCATAQRKVLASERAELRGFRREQDVRTGELNTREREQYERQLELNAREDALDERDRTLANQEATQPSFEITVVA